MSLIKCTECGKEISDKATTCPNCGCPLSMEEKKIITPMITAKSQKNKRIVIIIISIIVLIGVIAGIVFFNATAWKRNFDVKYIGYESNSYTGGIYTYNITNLTSKTYNKVKAVIHVKNIYGDFTFEDYIGTIRQHEEKEYKLNFNDVKNEAEKKEIKLMLAEVDIDRIIWS